MVVCMEAVAQSGEMGRDADGVERAVRGEGAGVIERGMPCGARHWEQRISVTLRLPARDLEEAPRRVHDVVGVDPTAFTGGYPLPL
jgi:hypothetical protein